jgi:hypothetical protein
MKSYQDMTTDELEEALARKFNMTSDRIQSQLNKNQNSMKTAKITKCDFNREWTGSNGTIYYHSIELDNDDYGDIGTKEKLPAKLSPGAEITYEITADGEFKGKKKFKIKLVSNWNGGNGGGSSAPRTYAPAQQFNGPNKDEAIARAVALKAAVDMNCSEDPIKILSIAQIFEQYLIHGKMPNDDAQANANSNAKMDTQDDDLPF